MNGQYFGVWPTNLKLFSQNFILFWSAFSHELGGPVVNGSNELGNRNSSETSTFRFRTRRGDCTHARHSNRPISSSRVLTIYHNEPRLRAKHHIVIIKLIQFIITVVFRYRHHVFRPLSTETGLFCVRIWGVIFVEWKNILMTSHVRRDRIKLRYLNACFFRCYFRIRASHPVRR